MHRRRRRRPATRTTVESPTLSVDFRRPAAAMAAIIYVPSDKSGPIALGSTTATDIVCGALGGRTWRRRCWTSSQFTAAAACHAGTDQESSNKSIRLGK